MCKCRRLVEEEVLDDQDLQRFKRMRHVLRVGIGLRDVLALHEQALERAGASFIEHVGDAQARLRIELPIPELLEQLTRCRI